RVLGEGPVGKVDAGVACVVEFNERIGRLVGAARAEFVDLHRADIPHLLYGGFRPLRVAGAGPRSAAHKIAVERSRTRRDLESSADARAWRNRTERSWRSVRRRRPPGWRSDG